MKYFLCIIALIGLVACGNTVTMDISSLEDQYRSLKPYWVSIIRETAGPNKKAQIAFSKNYKAARDFLNEFYDASRGVGPAGKVEGGARSNQEILWDLRKHLQYASKYTNQIEVLNQ